MKKYAANIITSMRIAMGIALFFVKPLSKAFYALYLICGLTDFIDGPIARATKNTTVIGAQLDTAGDVVMYLALFHAMLSAQILPKWAIYWLIAAAILFLISGIIARIKYGHFCFPHTLVGKSMGLIAFAFPLVYLFVNDAMINIYLFLACMTLTWAAIESIIIHVCSKELNIDVRSLLELMKLKQDS